MEGTDQGQRLYSEALALITALSQSAIRRFKPAGGISRNMLHATRIGPAYRMRCPAVVRRKFKLRLANASHWA